jgi:hypothetical protein
MKLDQVFAKAGFVILDAKKQGDNIVVLVRVPTREQIVPLRWKTWMDTVLGSAERATAWGVDVSKVFYSERGVMKYRWRIVLSGNTKQAQHMCVQAALNALRAGVEVNEIELIGQENLTPDPRAGKFRGAYKRGEMDVASQVVASAFTAIGG